MAAKRTRNQRTPQGTADLENKLAQYSGAASSVIKTAGVAKTAGRRSLELAGTAAALGAGLTMAPTAEAATVYSGVQNITLNGGSSSNIFFGPSQVMDMLNNRGRFYPALGVGGTYTGSGSSFTATYTVPYLAAFFDLRMATTGAGSVQRYSLGQVIGPLANPNPGVGTLFGFGSSSNGFAGVSFNVPGGANFGWIQIHRSFNQITLVDWAFESDLNTSIQAGQISDPVSGIPEPTSLSLLALGMAGIAAYRKSRKRVTQGSE